MSGYTADSLKAYLDEIGDHPILTREEERALAQRVEAGMAATAALADNTSLTAQERRSLRAAANDGKAAEMEFARCNLKLVASVAKRYRHADEEILEAIQNGNIGLMTAIRKFDWRKGFKFSTYATFWIRQSIDRGHQLGGQTIKLGGEAYMIESQMSRALSELSSRTGEDPSLEEVADHINRPVDKVRTINIARSVLSIDKPVGEDSSTGDFLAAEDTESADDEVSDLLADLNDFDRELLALRFGLSSGRPLSIADTATKLGISPARVKTYTNAALSRARLNSIVTAA